MNNSLYETSSLIGQRKSKSPLSQIKKHWLDWLVNALAGGLALYAFLTPPISKRLFPMEVYSDFAQENGYPVRKEILPTWLAGVIAAVSGLIIIGLAQIWVRSFKDFHRSLLGLTNALIGASWYQVMIKLFFGGFRPNFLSVCKPNLNLTGTGYYHMFLDRDACTQTDSALVDDALESFPSGHSTVALAGMVYLALYLNGKLKLWGTSYAATWKLFVVFFPLLAAALLSLSRLVDYTHHWYDILFGGIIGTVFAFSAYRMQFRSIFDPEWNGVLSPSKPKTHPQDYRFTNPVSGLSRSGGIGQQS